MLHVSRFRFQEEGFTLIELAVTIAVVTIVAISAFVALNPAGQFMSARNSQREAHLNTILNGIRQNIADHRGTFSCATGNIPSTSTKRMGTGAGNYDIYPCLVPVYLLSLPIDPGTSTAYFNSAADYNTVYAILRNATTGQITLSAPAAEKKTISITR